MTIDTKKIINFAVLTKPRIVAMTVLTGAWGMALAPGSMNLLDAMWALLGTGLCVGSANALNEYLERDVDRHMDRTRNRPLPRGRLKPVEALLFGLGIGVLSLLILGILVNPLTSALGGIALFVYVALYTPMKRFSSFALVVGAVAGAMPPLMGWTAATNELELPGLLIALTLFVWQIPHFVAISLFRQEDYERAGLKTVAQAWGTGIAKAYVIASSFALLSVSLLLPLWGKAGWAYSAAALVAGTVLFGTTLYGFRRDPLSTWARRYFGMTLVYLPLLAAGTLVDQMVR